MADVSKKAQIEITGRANDARRVLRALRGDIGGINTVLAEAGRTAGHTGRVMMTMSGAALAGLAQAGRMAADFGRGMAEVSTLVDTATVNMEGLAEGVKDLSVASGRGLDDLTKGLYDTISAGIDAGESIEFLRTASELAVGGVADVATSVDLLTTMVNAYGLEASAATDISDQLFATVKIGKTTIPELASAMQYVAGTASQAGVSSQEMLSALAALTLQGMPATVAARSLNQALLGFIKPSSEAAQKAAELGIGLNASTLESEGLAGALEEIRNTAGGDVEAMAQLAGSTQSLRALLALAGEGFGDFTAGLDSIGNAAGASGEAFAKMADSTADRMNRLRQQMEVIMVDIGEAVLPAAEAMAEDLMPQLERFAAWVEENPGNVERLGQVLVGVFATGAMLQATEGVLSMIATLKALGATATMIAGGAGIGAVALAIAAMAIATWDAIEDMKAAQRELAATSEESFQKIAGAMSENITEKMNDLGPTAQAAVREYLSALETARAQGENVTADAAEAVSSSMAKAREAMAQEGLDAQTQANMNRWMATIQANLDEAVQRSKEAAAAAAQPWYAWGTSVEAIQRRVQNAPPRPRGGGYGGPSDLYAGILTAEPGTPLAALQSLGVLEGDLLAAARAAQTRIDELEAESRRLRALDKPTEQQRERMQEVNHALGLYHSGMRELQSQMMRWTGRMEDVSVETDVLAEAMRLVIQSAGDGARSMQDLFEQVRDAVVGRGGVTAADFNRVMETGDWRSVEQAAAQGRWTDALQQLVAEMMPRLRELQSMQATPITGPGGPSLRAPAPDWNDISDRRAQDYRAAQLRVMTPGDRQAAERLDQLLAGGASRIGPRVPSPDSASNVPVIAGRAAAAVSAAGGADFADLFEAQTDEAMSVWEDFTADLETSWDEVTANIADRFISTLAGAIAEGEADFGNFADAIGRMMIEVGLRNVAAGAISGESIDAGSIGSLLGGVVGGPLGAIAGGLIGGLFDSPLNDIESRQSARDFSREFAAGVREGTDRRGGGGGARVINQNGTYVFAYPSDADTEAARQARALERAGR